MNALIRDYYPLFTYYQALRKQLLGVLSDDDLYFRILPDSASLGELFLDIGKTQRAYIESFHTFRLAFVEKPDDRKESVSVEALAGWLEALDDELKAVVETLTDQDLETRRVDRGDGFNVTLRHQLEIYKEALLIFYGKASVYLQALRKSPGEQWAHWIG